MTERQLSTAFCYTFLLWSVPAYMIHQLSALNGLAVLFGGWALLVVLFEVICRHGYKRTSSDLSDLSAARAARFVGRAHCGKLIGKSLPNKPPCDKNFDVVDGMIAGNEDSHHTRSAHNDKECSAEREPSICNNGDL